MTPEDFARQVFEAADEGLLKGVYRLASVRPRDVLVDLRHHGVDPATLDDIASLPVEQLDQLADRYIRQARRTAAISGASVGLGGWMGLPPGLMHLIVVVVRLAQRLSSTYGFDHTTGRGEIELWKSLANSVGAEVDWEGTEAELMRRLPAVVTGTGTFRNPLLLKAVQSVVVRVAAIYGLRAGRWVPLLSVPAGGAMNYVEVGRIGRRLKSSYRTRHSLSSFDPGTAVEVEVLATPGN